MLVGIAGGLLVFTGFWHATEWMMDGRRRDTWRLVPVGLVYLLLGVLLVLGTGGAITQVIAALAVAAGGFVAVQRRTQLQLRKWVIWTFVILDLLIFIALVLSWVI